LAVSTALDVRLTPSYLPYEMDPARQTSPMIGAQSTRSSRGFLTHVITLLK